MAKKWTPKHPNSTALEAAQRLAAVGLHPIQQRDKTGQGILVQTVWGSMIASVISHSADLVAFMEARGFQYDGLTTSTRLRPELQGQPKFKGLIGPCWGGDEHPLRYEDAETNNLLSI